MKPSEKIRIVFDGPPSHEGGRFVEVENEHGEGMSLGEWKQEGEYWHLEFPNPAQLKAENERRRELLIQREMVWGNFTRRTAEAAIDALLTGEDDG